MDAEPVPLGHRIDQVPEGGAARQGEVGALAVEDLGPVRGGEPGDPRRRLSRPEPGGIDEDAAGDLDPAVLAFGLDDEAAAGPRLGPEKGRAQCHHRPMVLRLALERQHVAMAVDDAGRGREQARHAPERRLHPGEVARVERCEVVDPVRRRRRGDPLEPVRLGRARDDDLAEPAVRHAMARAEGVERLAARAAEGGLGAVPGIVDAGVDHLGIAGAGVAADPLLALQHDHLMPRQRQGAGHRKPHHPGAHHHRAHLVHVRLRFPPRARARSGRLPPGSPLWPGAGGCASVRCRRG